MPCFCGQHRGGWCVKYRASMFPAGSATCTTCCHPSFRIRACVAQPSPVSALPALPARCSPPSPTYFLSLNPLPPNLAAIQTPSLTLTHCSLLLSRLTKIPHTIKYCILCKGELPLFFAFLSQHAHHSTLYAQLLSLAINFILPVSLRFVFHVVAFFHVELPPLRLPGHFAGYSVSHCSRHDWRIIAVQKHVLRSCFWMSDVGISARHNLEWVFWSDATTPTTIHQRTDQTQDACLSLFCSFLSYCLFAFRGLSRFLVEISRD